MTREGFRFAKAERRRLSIVFHIAMLATAVPAFADVAAQPQPHAVSSTHIPWQSPATGMLLTLIVHEPEGDRQDTPRPLIFYLENLATPRLGTESDESILKDWSEAGDWVVTIDYASHPQARVPFINPDLAKLRDDLMTGKFLTQRKVDPAQVFIVPSGSRLRRDVKFYSDDGRDLAMDIIYPSRPTQPVGAIIEFSCDNQNRMGNGSLVICSDTILEGEATEGFAVAMADHPVAPPYKGLDPMPDCAWKIKAAVRTLRAQGAELRLNDRIAAVGFSRGSGMALMLATTEGLGEFEGRGEHPTVSSAVQAAVVMSGRFTYLDLLEDDHMIPRYTKAWGERESNLETWRRHGAMDYLSQATLPLFLTINCTEGTDALHQMTVLRKRLADLGNDEIFMMDRTPRGHKVTLDPAILGAINDYLKRRLR